MGLFNRRRRSKEALEDARRLPEWAETGAWGWWTDPFGDLPPLDCVVGESHHQDVLSAVCGPVREIGYCVPVNVALAREPDNPYDANAVVVALGLDGANYQVGYIARDAAALIAPCMDARVPRGSFMTGVPGAILGGKPDFPSFGVRIWLNHDDVAGAIGLDPTPLKAYEKGLGSFGRA